MASDVAKLVFHLPDLADSADIRTIHPVYHRLFEAFAERGGQVEFRNHDDAATRESVDADGNFHICHHGQVPHERVLNAGLSYVRPYWNFDPTGIRARASIHKARFNPAEVDRKAANQLFRKLNRKFVEKRVARIEQPKDDTVLPDEAVTVLLQEATHGIGDFMGYLDREELVFAVGRAEQDRPIILKTHPNDTGDRTEQLLSRACDAFPNMIVFGGNIHDALARSAVTVSINSGGAFEGFLHKVPAVICGRADFRHRTQTVKTGDAMKEAIETAIAKPMPYEKYVYWFLEENCVSVQSPDMLEKLLQRISNTGFDVARFGLGVAPDR